MEIAIRPQEDLKMNTIAAQSIQNPRAMSAAQSPLGIQAVPAEKAEPMSSKSIQDSFSFSDGVNNPLEAALLPSTDQVLSQAITPFMMQGGVTVQGEITRKDRPDYKEYINVQIDSEAEADQATGQMKGDIITRAAYGVGTAATYMTERGTLVTFENEGQQAPGMRTAGYIDTDPNVTDVKEQLSTVMGPGWSLMEGNASPSIDVSIESQAFIPGVDPDKVKEEDLDPTKIGSCQRGTIGGVSFERSVVPDGFPSYLIEGRFGELKEKGTLTFAENKAIIDREIGPFRIHEEVKSLMKSGASQQGQ